MNHSVIELAKLLTQALDENFNIKNQSAVVKVVTWLEAFNITHESYREVQNTRIIKDLQALRQNKANDQVLAKRIKNLLRKWKERLASSVPSQPNSPQNISQGSSDTQFMTQQSQSPPNSQPPRLVNGPTSFKNLLPKSQNHHYQVTSPVPQHHQHHHNNPHHIHQNGGIIESSQQSNNSLLLGKRKMDGIGGSNSLSGVPGEIDENSNHSKKTKLMKKSENHNFGATSSPLLVNANSNSSSMHHQQKQQHLKNNNQQIINNKIHSNVPVQPPTPHQPPIPSSQQNNHLQLQQQSLTPTTTPQQQPLPLKKVEGPRKGRRKGSRGFDATLNGNIPDFQAEIQQKIALSAGKRNKTTFELQQMLESHQNTNTSWTNGDIHDSNSLDRVNNYNTSSYNPPEPVYSAFDVKKEVTEIKREPFDESQNSTLAGEDEKKLLGPPQKTSALLKNELASSSLRSLEPSIEDEIAKLYAKLPPIDLEAAMRARFDDLESYDKNGKLVSCTCTFREVITYEDEEQSKTNGFEETPLTMANNNNIKNNNKVNINGDNINNNSNNNNSNSINKKPEDSEDEDDDDDDETDDFCAVEDVVIEKSPPQSAVKSIFDPEYDEYDANENLIEEMMVRRKQTRDNLPKIIQVKIEKDDVKSSRIESMINPAVAEPPSIQQMERVPIINYVCDEDIMCRAREHFERDPITNSDVERLHNSFVNGVNGYWNGILEEQQEPDYSKDSENIDYAKHQLWKRVVPRYNFLTLDKIPKKFNNSPFSIPPPPPPEKISSTTDESTSDGIKSNEESNSKKKNASLNDAMELDDDTLEEKFSMHKNRDIEFREWHEVMNVRSYNDEILTILPYVVID